MSNSPITKSKLESMFAKGTSVKDVASQLTNEVGIKIPVSFITKKCKEWNINLKKKPTTRTKTIADLFRDDTLDVQSTTPNDSAINSSTTEQHNTIQPQTI